MKRVVVYGQGNYYEQNKRRISGDIVGFVNSFAKTNVEENVYAPEDLPDEIYDELVICTDTHLWGPIIERCKDAGIPLKKIVFLWMQIHKDFQIECVENRHIVTTPDGVKVALVKRTDYDVFHEIFSYSYYGIDVLPETVIIDIGMNIGMATLYFASKKEVAKVYGYEPFSDTYMQAVDNINLNPQLSKKVKACNVGLGKKNMRLDAAVNTSMTAWRSIRNKTDGQPFENIEMRNAAEVIISILEENKNARIGLKIDVEGSEFEIFDSIKETDILEHLDFVIMEYHRHPDTILKQLRENGFRCYIHGFDVIGCICAIKS